MTTIEVDGVQYAVKAEQNLLSACLTLGLDLPYFCWHPALGSVGACRQCAVISYRDANDSKGRLVMACMTPVADGMRVAFNNAQARQFRAENIELLMINHPHDCPVCEEGGECHLQDMTLMTGHTIRRYHGQKRTHKNQNLGPFINHEMNRCIACYRCVRFYEDYAGGKDLQAMGIHNNVYFGRFEEGALENEFSGNLVEVCPTGVFTDKTFSTHYTRKWDLQTAPSVCVHCSLGCNISPGERYGTLRRVVNRYNGEINGYFLCDRGRFGYGFINSDNRIKAAVVDGATVINEAIAEQHFRQLLDGEQSLMGIGSPRASLEANFALQMLVGEENFFLGLNDTEQALLETIGDLLQKGGIHTPSLREVEQADAVLLLGEDLTQSAPRLALSVRQAARNAVLDMARRLKIPMWQEASVRDLQHGVFSPVYIASLYATRLDDIAANCYRGSPEDIARLGFAIAYCLDSAAPAPKDLIAHDLNLATTIANSLKSAKRPLIISGTSCGSLAVIQAAYNVARALPSETKGLTYTMPECNSLGLALMGGKRLKAAFDEVNSAHGKTVIILENDLYRRAETQTVEYFLNEADNVVVLDSLDNMTSKQADLLLPSATFAESEGSLVNNEGRAQRYFPVYLHGSPIRGSWQWLLSGLNETTLQHFDDLTAACAEAFPVFAAIGKAAPTASYRAKGMKIPRQPHRYSGRTAVLADVIVSEPQQPFDDETPYTFSMEGATPEVVPAAYEPVFWSPGWSSNQAVNKFQDEIGGRLRGGDIGIRLVEAPSASNSVALDWFTDIPDTFKPIQHHWRVINVQHIFGSEELSAQSPPIIERTPNLYAMLNPADAENLKVDSGELLDLTTSESMPIMCLPVKLEPSLPCGLIGIPTGFSATAGLMQNDIVKLIKADALSVQSSDQTGSKHE
jgi:NADH-quinone oxidoreductase subunit G